MAARAGLPLAALTAALLAGCQPAPPPSPFTFRSAEEPYAVAARLSDAIAACWFGANAAYFGDYLFAPELNSYSDRPRILLVPRSEPTGRPVLVVEAVPAAGGSAVSIYGPLLTRSAGPPVAADVERWTAGAAGCS